ncbi:hypothetical protein BGX31_008991, partial [Mortierella sp. GBA43]
MERPQQLPAVETEVSSSAAVDYAYASSSSSMAAVPGQPMLDHLLAEALAREGFPGFASVLAFTEDQRQLEQVSVQPSLEPQQYSTTTVPFRQDQQRRQQLQMHQQQQLQMHNLQDDSYLLNFMMHEHNDIMTHHGYNNNNASSSSAFPQ